MRTHSLVPTRRDLGLAAVLAFGAGLVLHLVHGHLPEQHELPPVLHWLRDSALALPLALAAVVLGRLVSGAVSRWLDPREEGGRTGAGAEPFSAPALVGVLTGALVYAWASIPGNLVHGLLFVGESAGGHHEEGVQGLAHLLADASVALGAAVVVLLAALVVGAAVPRVRRPGALLAGLPLVAASFLVPVTAVSLATAGTASGATVDGCDAAGADRRYDVAAIGVTIPYNRFGAVDENGMVFVLEQDRRAVESWHLPLDPDPEADPARNRRLRPRPLVLRANEGECVEVTFTNRLPERALQDGAVVEPRASMHVDGAATSARLAGAHVGFAGDSTVGRGETITYYWRAPSREGLHVIRDMAMSAGGEADGGSLSHGLWGAFVVEPAGSTWRDSHTGLPLYPTSSVAQVSGELYLDADVTLPSGTTFRETVQLSQDEIPHIGFGFNYGADSQRYRDERLCPDCVGEETSLSSWTYGEPAAVKLASGLAGPAGWPVGPGTEPEDCQSDDGSTAPRMMMPAGIPGGCWTSNVSHAYPGDPTKIRFGHAGVKETHVFHMHAHQWLNEPHDVGTAGSNPTSPDDAHRPESTTIDSQTYGPGDTYTADLLFGAGSKAGTIGDSIFHCHLYPHFADGFWSLFRVHDVREDGTLETPDGVRTRLLTVLPDRTGAAVAPSEYDAGTNPGFPRFVPGKFGWRAPQPPGSISAPDGTPATRLVGGQGLDESLINQTQDVTAAFPRTDEVQQVSNDAAGGSFTLSLGGETTAPLAYDATAADVEAALAALPSVGTGNVSVTSPQAQAWRVAFGGALAGRDLALLSAQDSFTTPPLEDPLATPPAPGSSTVTLVQDGGRATGGFTLRYRGEETAALASDAAATAVETALEALGTIDDATVTARGDTGSAWRVEIHGRNVRPLTSAAPEVSVDTVEGAWHRALAAERAAMEAAYAGTGTGPKPGAPFVDPCPTGAREVRYDVAVIQRDLVYNSDGWHDPQGRLLVLRKDVDDIMAGRKKPEPLFFRVNAGDCVDFRLTNMLPNWYGDDAFQVLQQTNMFGQHIHLVKFDVLASDGASNGWNYQQAAFSAGQEAFNRRVLDGTQSCSADETTGACRMALPPAGTYDPSTAGVFDGQTIRERWYADYELRTVFTHDHHFPAVDQGRGLFGGLIVEPSGTDFRNSRTGTWHQPIDDPAHGPVCGSSCTGDAAGTMFDIVGPGAKDDFREFGLAFQDFVPLVRAGGDPRNPEDVFNPPHEPETYADEDPGVMGINYRNEPFLIRDTVSGKPVDPAYVFSSTVHGDPATPVLEAYAGDPVRIRLVGGSQEEQHVFGLHGMKWRDEPDDPGSQYVASRSLGVSDAFNFEIPEMECTTDDCDGDYLYSSTATDDLYLGMWGLMRVHGKGTSRLLPLPDNAVPSANGTTSPNVTGSAPPKANQPGTACPTGAPVRSITVAATDARIDYNRHGDHDPYGLVYVAAEDGETVADAVARVRRDPQPMSLRANEGDCIEVRLHNRIDPNGAFATQHAPLGVLDGDPALPLEPSSGTPAGLRVSLHAQMLSYDVRGSDGATVGFNRDQTVAPGDDILYRWYAPDVTPGELGTVNLTDYGDVRGHRHHGLAASLTVEPKGSTYHDPISGEQVVSAAVADIRTPGRADFREFTAHFQDGLNLRDASGALVPDGFAHPPVPGEPPETLDAEDRGEKGFNYASTPYRHRLGVTPMSATADDPMTGRDLADVLSSAVHGDPDTPVFRAYAGDPVRVRVVQGGDKPRQHNVTVHGHSWLSDPWDPRSNVVGNVGGLTVDRAANLHLDSAGNGQVGDWLYGDTVAGHHLSGGTWGILRTYASPPAEPLFEPSALRDRTSDDPALPGNQPLLPLELSKVTVSVFDDSDMDGVRKSTERRGPDTTVTLTADDGSTRTEPVDSHGKATFWVGRGAYDVRAGVPADWRRTSPATTRVDVSADGASESVAVGMVQLADVGVRLYHDSGSDIGTREPDEPGLAGWTVTMTRGSETFTATTDAHGYAGFDGLVPGDWKIASTGKPGWQSVRSLPVTRTVVENESQTTANETNLGWTLPAGLSVHVFNDADDDGARDAGESNKAGWTVTATGGTPERQRTLTATTDAQGVAVFTDPANDDPATPSVEDGLLPGTWRLSVATRGDWSMGTKASATTTGPDGSSSPTPGFDCASPPCTTVLVDETAQVAKLPVRNPFSWLVTTPFNDVNNDGVKQDKEQRLGGWEVTAIAPDGTPFTLETGADGRATHYPMAPGAWRLEMISPERSTDPSILDWTSTNRQGCTDHGDGRRRCVVSVDVLPGETAHAGFGFVQLGTISVDVWHDTDRDGIHQDERENHQPNRTVRLYNATGKTLLETKVTDWQGHVAFKAATGVKYQVQVVLPSGWVQTAPLDNGGKPVARIVAVGPAGTESYPIEVGQYNTNDSIAPPVPTSSVPAGSYTEPQTVTLASETGATIRYSLSGAAPTATTGLLYTGPITVSNPRLLRAVAIDRAGNVSAELGVDGTPGLMLGVTIPGTSPATATAGGWQVLTGGTPTPPSGMTLAQALALDDSQRLLLPSAFVKSSKKYVVDGVASVTLPSGQRDLAALGVEVDGRANLAGSLRSLSLWDTTANAWVTLFNGVDQPIVDLRSVYDVSGDPRRFVNARTGEVKVRFVATRSSSYDVRLDQVQLRIQHR